MKLAQFHIPDTNLCKKRLEIPFYRICVEIDGQTGTPSYRDAATHLKREEEQRARAKRLNHSMVQNEKKTEKIAI